MKLTDIFENVPSRIPDDHFDLNTLEPDANEYHYLDGLGNKKHIMNYNGIEVYEVQNRTRENLVVGLNHNTERLDFYCYYDIKDVKDIGTVCMEQLVWSSRSNRVKGLPKKVYFDYLLKQYHTIRSDKSHSSHGERFWKTNIETAFNLGLFVYWHNKATRKLYKIASYNDFLTLLKTTNVWGEEDEGYGDFTLLISDKNVNVNLVDFNRKR